MSDSNRVRIAYIEESTYAESESGSNLQTLRVTGESLAQQSGSSISNEIRDGRQVANVRRTKVEAGGGINFELSYGTYDELLAAALLDSAWSSEVEVGPISTISAAASGNTISDSGSGFGSLVAGQWVKISGFTTTGLANNGYWKILTSAAGSFTVSGGTIADKTAGDSVTVTMGGHIENGTTLPTYNVERQYVDLTTDFSLFVGMALNSLSLNVPLEGEVTGALEFVGHSESSETSSDGTGYDAATTTDPYAAVDVDGLLENQTALAILSFTMNLNNNLRNRLQVGSTGVASVGTGRVEISGTVSAYYTTSTLYDKFLDETASSLAVTIEDPAGNGYVIDLPQVKFSNASRPAGGVNTDVVVSADWQAYMDPSETITIQIARFPV